MSSDGLSYGGKSRYLSYGTSSLTLAEATADYATCAAATGWAKNRFLEPHLLTTPQTCLRLDSDHYGMLTVLRSDDASVEVAITVWE